MANPEILKITVLVVALFAVAMLCGALFEGFSRRLEVLHMVITVCCITTLSCVIVIFVDDILELYFEDEDQEEFHDLKIQM